MAESVKFSEGMEWSLGPFRAQLADLVRWAGATSDFTEFHFDAEAARNKGFDGPVVNGPWKARLLRRVLEREFQPEQIAMPKFEVEYHRPDTVGEELTASFLIIKADDTVPGSRRLTIRGTLANSAGEISTVAHAEVTLEAHQDSGELPIEATRKAVKIGKPNGPFVYTVGVDDVRRYQLVTGRPVDDVDDYMPAAFFGALDPVERRDLVLDDFLLGLPIPKVGGGNAFNQVDYERRICSGEELTVVTTYTEVYEKEGRSSRLLFRVRENEFRDQQGERVATSRNGHVLAFAKTGVGSP